MTIVIDNNRQNLPVTVDISRRPSDVASEFLSPTSEASSKFSKAEIVNTLAVINNWRSNRLFSTLTPDEARAEEYLSRRLELQFKSSETANLLIAGGGNGIYYAALIFIGIFVYMATLQKIEVMNGTNANAATQQALARAREAEANVRAREAELEKARIKAGQPPAGQTSPPVHIIR